MKKSLSNWKGVPTANCQNFEARSTADDERRVSGWQEDADGFGAGFRPGLDRGGALRGGAPGTAVVGLMADGAAFAIDAMEDFRDAIKRKRAKRKKLLGLPFSHPARKQRRSRYDRAAEISEKITDGAEIAGAVALNTSKVATRWLGKAGKVVGKAAGGVAAMARNHTVAEEGAEEVVDDEVVEDDEDAEEVEEPPAEEEEAVVAPSAPEPEVAPGGAASSPGGGGGRTTPSRRSPSPSPSPMSRRGRRPGRRRGRGRGRRGGGRRGGARRRGGGRGDSPGLLGEPRDAVPRADTGPQGDHPAHDGAAVARAAAGRADAGRAGE